METLLLNPDREGERIDSFLARRVPELSRSAAQRLIADGLVMRGGVSVKKNERLSGPEPVCVTLPAPQPLSTVPQEIPLDIVYEDADIIVVNKPVGMVVHPAAGHPDGTLVNALLWHCGNSLSGINGTLRPGIVHRIDRDTSGLLVAAKHDAAHRALAAQLQDHSMYRIYEAVCVGCPSGDWGTVDAPIARHKTDRKRMAVVPGGRPAVTHWDLLARGRGHALIQCRLETGRTHQIRVHMSYIGHPLLGDTVYGVKRPVPGLAGQCLHARRLSLVHPTSHRRMDFEAPRPTWFETAWERVR